MFVREFGNGPVILCLHGTPSPAEDFLPLATALAPEYRVLVPDLPGYGDSPAPASHTMEAIGDAIAAMLRDRGVTELRSIVGYSTGAYRAFDLVVRHAIPTGLIVSLAGIVTFDQAARDMRRQLGDALQADPSFIDSPTVHDVMRQLMISEPWRRAHPEDEQRVIAWLRTTTAPMLAAECLALATMRDLRPEICGLATPVYARVGELDGGATPAASEEIVRLVQRGELDVVGGCGHALWIEDAAGTLAAIVKRIRN